MSKEYKHECDHDEITEIAEYWERQAHEAGKCVGIPLCGDCLDAWYESNKDAKELRIEPKSKSKSKLEQEDD